MSGNCKQRIKNKLMGRLDDLRRIMASKPLEDEDEPRDIYDYGLGFDYVPKGTFDGQGQGYFRYQLSWGGPADEFRFFTDAARKVHRVEYWFLDWFDGAKKILRGKNEKLLLDVFDLFEGCGAVESEFEKAREAA